MKCECNYEIRLLPDLKAIDQAINNLLLEHKNRGGKDFKAKRIEDALISQILRKLLNQKLEFLNFPDKIFSNNKRLEFCAVFKLIFI
jgi:hypothetical protein